MTPFREFKFIWLRTVTLIAFTFPFSVELNHLSSISPRTIFLSFSTYLTFYVSHPINLNFKVSLIPGTSILIQFFNCDALNELFRLPSITFPDHVEIFYSLFILAFELIFIGIQYLFDLVFIRILSSFVRYLKFCLFLSTDEVSLY